MVHGRIVAAARQAFRKCASGAFWRNKRDATKRSPGQSALLRAVRLQGNKDMGAIVRGSSVDDLVWFLHMLELQLEETPHWVTDEQLLHDIQAWSRRVRTMVTEVLHNKRVKARPRKWLLATGKSLFLLLLGAAIATAFTKIFL